MDNFESYQKYISALKELCSHGALKDMHDAIVSGAVSDDDVDCRAARYKSSMLAIRWKRAALDFKSNRESVEGILQDYQQTRALYDPLNRFLKSDMELAYDKEIASQTIQEAEEERMLAETDFVHAAVAFEYAEYKDGHLL